MVEDEESILTAMSEYLANFGYEVDAARELEQAEAMLASRGYAAVISDLRLTGTDANEGLRLATAVRRKYPETEFILMSAYGSPQAEQEARAQGVAAFLHKPKPLAEVAQILMSVLGEPAQAAVPPGSGVPPVSRPLPVRFQHFRLTGEELEVARLVGEGKDNAQIAAQLGIDEARVRRHRDTLAVRLDPRSRFELALYLVRRGNGS